MKTYCTNPDHQPGQHDASCMPPADRNNPELRLLRAIFGLCSLCDVTDPHSHVEDRPRVAGLVKLTKAQRTELARKRVCPECHTEANRPCRGRAARGLRPPMKTVHAKRLELIPKEVPDGD